MSPYFEFSFFEFFIFFLIFILFIYFACNENFNLMAVNFEMCTAGVYYSICIWKDFKIIICPLGSYIFLMPAPQVQTFVCAISLCNILLLFFFSLMVFSFFFLGCSCFSFKKTYGLSKRTKLRE